MSLQDINIGTGPNTNTGDDARTVGQKINTNFSFLEDRIDGVATGYQGELAIADTPLANGYYLATESGTYTNAGSVVVDLNNGLTLIHKDSTNYSTTVIPISAIPTGDIAEGETEAVTGDKIYKAIPEKVIEYEQAIKSRYNFINDLNNDVSLYSINTVGTITKVTNTFLGGYPNMFDFDLTGQASGAYNLNCNIGGFTNNRIFSFACDIEGGDPSYFQVNFTFYDYDFTALYSNFAVRNSDTLGEVVKDDAYYTATVYKIEDGVIYTKVEFKQDLIFELTKFVFGTYNASDRVASFGSFALVDATNTTDLQLLYYQDDSIENPYLVDPEINYTEIRNLFFDDSGVWTNNKMDATTTDYRRGFRDNNSTYSSEITTENDYLENRLVYKYQSLPVTTTFDLVGLSYDTFPLEIEPTTSNIGFWVDVTNLDDFFKISTSGADFVWLAKIGLGEVETASYYLGITDRIKTDNQDWYYINFRNKDQLNTEIEIGNLSANITTTDISIGGMTYTNTDYKLSGRTKYKTIAEDETALIGKSACFVGDSIINGTVLIRRFAQLTGISDIYMAAENGASIGSSAATYWIYDYRDWIITQEPDFVVYGISSNDWASNTGTSADVDDGGVTNSFYKWYFQFMRYILSNTSAISGSAVTNLSDKGHFMCSWFTRDDSTQPLQRESVIEKVEVIDELSRYFTCNFIDIHRSVGWTVDNANDLGDGIHPEQFTHNKVANLIKHHTNLYFK